MSTDWGEHDDGGREPREDGCRTVVVGLLADPDLPASLARKLVDDLPGLLARRADQDVSWKTEYARDPFEALQSPDRLIDKAQERVRYSNWDLAVAITDVPVRSKGAVVVADVDEGRRVALLSIPALGGVRLRARARAVVVPIVAFAAWLIISHQLWEPTSPSRRSVPGACLRNAGTVFTIGFGALVFFVSLFVLAFAGACVVIPPEHLEGVLGEPVGWPHYLTVALMASVLGIAAGAVGSGLEDDTTVRRVTYGYRERERWREIRGTAQG